MGGSGEHLICASTSLLEGGDGVRFMVRRGATGIPAFAVRHGGRVHAYLNRCAHRGVQLDWEPGRFLDAGRRYLICAMHGALYEPASGNCAAGPCSGGLAKLEVIEKNNAVYLASSDATGFSGDGK